jgi:uncharacterized membrane protein (UPF0127 family)
MLAFAHLPQQPRTSARTSVDRLRAALHSCALGAAMAAQLLCASVAWAQQGPQHLPAIQLGAGIHLIHAEVAQSEEEHEIGLMNRTDLGTNDGMIFIFERSGQQCFWMKNTLIPLAVAFIGDDGTVVNVDEMKAQTLDPHCSTQPVRFVLEMNKGWFSKRGIRAGSKLSGPPFNASH